MKFTKQIAISLFLFVAFLGALGAIDFQVPPAIDITGFGTILAIQDSAIAKELQRTKSEPALRSDIVLKTEDLQIKAPSSGVVVYSQRESSIASVFSFPLGGAVAMLHPDSYLSLISGISLDTAILTQARQDKENSVKKATNIGQASGSGIYPQQYFGLRLLDRKNSLWINPLFLASWISDRTAPVIQNVWLAHVKMQENVSIELKTAVPKGKYIECQQGTYEISVLATDSIIPGSKSLSAPYRFVVILDGKTSIDTSFVAATCKSEGLSFLGNPAPSSKVILGNGAYRVGSILLQRGQHEIEVQVSDYADNKSILKASIMVN